MEETTKPEKPLSDLFNKPLSERVLDHLQSELFHLSLQLETLANLVQYYGMEGCGLDNRGTDGLGLILQGLADKVCSYYEQALDWQYWKDPQKETDRV